MEKIVNAKILNFFKTNTFLYPLQSGFLPTHSTVTQLAYLVHKWQMALDRGESIESVFLDLSKAYDRVSHQGLISKLSTCGFSYSSVEWMSNFVSHRKQCVRLNGTESTWLAPRSGIPQGTVLGPMLLCYQQENSYHHHRSSVPKCTTECVMCSCFHKLYISVLC